MTATAQAKKSSKSAPAKNSAKKPKVAPLAAPVGRDVMVPLNLLFIDDENARKTRTPEGISELADLIESQGLMQRLSIVERAGGRFGVVAGGRRLTALEFNVERGKLAKDAAIECKLYESTRAVQLSLAENSGREAMHPADQMEGFKHLIDVEGLTVAQVAGRFGVTPLTVEKRLKLARLSPRFLMMYREDKIAQDQLQALALVEDHAAQEAAWDSLSTYDRSAYHIRNALTETECDSDSKLAVFVGLEAYSAAGGTIRQDLFATEGDGIYLQDSALLHSLATAKLRATAESIEGEGWAWVESTLEGDSAEYRNFGRERQGQRAPTEGEAAELTKLRADFEAKEQAWNTFEDEADYEHEDYASEERRLGQELSEAEDRLEAATEALTEWQPEQKARAGVLVKVGYRGALEIQRGLVRPGDKKAAVAAMQSAGDEVPYDMKKGVRAEFSERLMKDMTAHRTAALQAAMVDHPRVALVALVHRFALTLFGSYHSDSPVQISLRETSQGTLAQNASEFGETPAAEALDRAETRWGDVLPGEPAALFRWLMTQPESTLLELLAYCTARSLDVQTGRERKANQSDTLADALGLDMADWWTPTPAKYLSSVSKAKMIEAVTEAAGADAAKEVGGMKKAEAVEFCAAKLEGTRWLPAPLKQMGAAQEAGSDE